MQPCSCAHVHSMNSPPCSTAALHPILPGLTDGTDCLDSLCAALARMELKIVFEELLIAMKGKQAEPANEIRFIRSNRHQGVAEMRVRVL